MKNRLDFKIPFDYDIIITDIIMPNLSGWSIAEETLAFYKDRMDKKPKIGIFSGDGLAAREDKKADQIDVFMNKPIFKKDLLDTLNEISKTL